MFSNRIFTNRGATLIKLLFGHDKSMCRESCRRVFSCAKEKISGRTQNIRSTVAKFILRWAIKYTFTIFNSIVIFYLRKFLQRRKSMLNSKAKLSGKTLATLIAGVVIIALLIIAKVTGNVNATFWALLPPVIAIGLALITKEVYSSLFIGIVSGAILAAQTPLEAVDHTVTTGIISAVSGTAGIFVF
jgi:Na+/H+ antiporter NhaC